MALQTKPAVFHILLEILYFMSRKYVVNKIEAAYLNIEILYFVEHRVIIIYILVYILLAFKRPLASQDQMTRGWTK